MTTGVSLRIRLGIAFGFLVAILIAVGWLGLSRMGRVSSDLNATFDRHYAKVQLARDAAYHSGLNNRITMQIFLSANKADIPQLLTQRTANLQKVLEDVKNIQANSDSPTEKDLLNRIQGLRSGYREAYSQAIDQLTSHNNPADARQIVTTAVMPMLGEYLENWNTFVDFEEGQMAQAREQSRANYLAARRLTILLISLGVILALGVAVFVTRKLVEEATQLEHTKLEIRKLNQSLESKVSERTLQLSRLAAVVESSGDAIIRASADGIILSWNAAAERIYGYSATEIIGKPASVLAPPDRVDEVRQLLERVTHGEKMEQFETVRLRKDGRQIPVALTLSAVGNDNGSIDDVAAIVRDITERKRMEETLRQAQKMEAVGRLAGGVAHDFNNLLGVIVGYSELLLDQLGDNGTLRKYAEQIRKGGERASELTRQLLAFGRQQVTETKVFNLNAIIVEMAVMLPRLIGEHIELCTRLDGSLGNIKADQGQVEQVIMNLVVNARDAMPEGGKLVIQTSNVRVDATDALQRLPMTPGDYVKLVVSDTGVGMDAQIQAHIFEPFFTTKEPGRGTGLGLATVYAIVKQSGGYTWVDSEAGCGATFTIYFPFVKTPVQQVVPSGGAARLAQASATVLLVEDEDSLRQLTRIFLEQGGYSVLEADGPGQAIQIALKHRGHIDLLLTDVVMPGMNGPALADKLAPILPDTNVVYMSGYVGFVAPGLAGSDAVVLAKPFTREALLCKLQEMSEKQLTH